jgi:predicted metal-dependent peptidase
MDAKSKLTKARTALVLDSPFFGSLALRLKMTEDLNCKTAWTDGTTLGYNATWIEGLDLAKVKAVIAHEVMHLAMLHHTRRQEREPRNWNIAGDIAINETLQRAGFALPEGALYPDPDQGGKSAEEIYSKLPQAPRGLGQGQGQGKGKGKGQGQAQGQQQGPGQDPGNCGEVRDPQAAQGDQGQSKASPADIQQAEESWRVAVQQAAQQAKAAGKLPGSMDRLIENTINPRLPWQDLLRRFVNCSKRSDYSWLPPSKRFLGQGLYLPSMRSEGIENLVVAIDTSGSLDPETLNEFAGELSGVIETGKTRVTVIYCDSDIQDVAEFGPDDLPLKLEAKGGGGTSFIPPFDYVDEHGIEPSCFIYLTDFCCNRFPDPPNYPVLWIIGGAYREDGEPPFGERIDL